VEFVDLSSEWEFVGSNQRVKTVIGVSNSLYWVQMTVALCRWGLGKSGDAICGASILGCVNQHQDWNEAVVPLSRRLNDGPNQTDF